MRVVTLTACSRVHELEQVLDALEPQLGGWTLSIGIDGLNADVAALVKRRTRPGWIVRQYNPPLGIEAHQCELVRRALDMGASAVAGLQDDTLPLPGAVAFWDSCLSSGLQIDVGLLAAPSMGLTASGGRAVYRPCVPSGVGTVRLGPVFNAAGFVADSHVMRDLLAHWHGPSDYLDGNGDRYVGWDWSLNSAMRRLGLTAWAPRNPLVRDIGASGVHTDAETHALVNAPD